MAAPKRSHKNKYFRLKNSLKRFRGLKGVTQKRRWISKLPSSDIATLCTCTKKLLKTPEKFLTQKTRQHLDKHQGKLRTFAFGKGASRRKNLDQVIRHKGAGFFLRKLNFIAY